MPSLLEVLAYIGLFCFAYLVIAVIAVGVIQFIHRVNGTPLAKRVYEKQEQTMQETIKSQRETIKQLYAMNRIYKARVKSLERELEDYRNEETDARG